MHKFKKTLLVLSSLFLLSGVTASIAKVHVAHAEETSSTTEATEVVEEDLRQANIAKDNLYINCDLNNVVANLYLPTKGVYDAKISWLSSNTKIIRTSGIITRPTDADTTVTLTATIQVRTAIVEKEFTAVVLKETTNTFTRAQRFEENFSSYKTGQDLSNYYIWELKNGDEIAKVKESVENNNMIGLNAEDKVLEIEPLSTLYKDSIYQTKVNLASSMVLETYVMTAGDIAGFQLELGTSSSSKLTIGMVDGNFVTGKDEYDETTGAQTSAKTLTPYDDGVWYKLRVEINISKEKFNAYYYDWKNDGNLVSITKDGGESCSGLTVSQNDYFKMRVLTGRHSGKIYVSNIVIDVPDNVTVSSGSNPNRTKGIGEIENYTSSYLLVENEDFTLPEFIIHNRFGDKEVLSEGTDYTISKTYGDAGELDITKQGNYEIHYVINLLFNGEIYETKELDQTFYVDNIDATAQLSTLRICPIVKDTDETYIDKKIKISANINRKDSIVYYAAVESGSSDLTKEQIINGQSAISGNLTVTESSFSIEIEGLDKTKEYDFFVVTKNINGISDIYIKRKISVSVYNIEDADDFFFMCTDPEVQTTNFRLLNDIDFADYFWAANEITRPNYVGEFDGQGHTISNLHIEAPYKKASLFYNFAGTFKNLTFKDCYLAGNESVGFIGGYGAGGAYVENIKMDNCEVICFDESDAGDGYYGLIFGRCEGGSSYGNAVIDNIEITNCRVSGPKYVGGIVGNLQKMDSLTVSNVYAEISIESTGAALALISRARAPLTFKNIIADINIIYGKKQAAVLCGEIITQVYAENIMGRLVVQGLTQPTYYNNVTGNYSKADGTKFTYKNVYFFTPDTSIMSEDTVTSVSSSLTVGTVVSGTEFGTTKEWWEKNTWLIDLDTNENWYFDETLNRPSPEKRDMISLSFTADEVNAYIDAIGGTISSSSLYYIRKAQELLEYTPDSEKSKVHMDALNAAIEAYQEYYEGFTDAITGINQSTTAIVGGIDWSFTEKGTN